MMLILARALLGIAGATLQPSILALISNMFRDDRQRSTAISIWASSLLVGVALGPLVGGALLQKFWWGSVFLIGVPIMLVLLATAPFLVPEYRDRDSGRIDLPSVLLSLAAVIPIVFAVKEAARAGLTPDVVFALVIGVVSTPSSYRGSVGSVSRCWTSGCSATGSSVRHWASCCSVRSPSAGSDCCSPAALQRRLRTRSAGQHVWLPAWRPGRGSGTAPALSGWWPTASPRPGPY